MSGECKTVLRTYYYFVSKTSCSTNFLCAVLYSSSSSSSSSVPKIPKFLKFPNKIHC